MVTAQGFRSAYRSHSRQAGGQDWAVSRSKTEAWSEPETEEDPVGLLGTKAFLCPPFLDYRK